MVTNKIKELEEKLTTLEKEHASLLDAIAKLKYAHRDKLLEELKEKFVGRWIVITNDDSCTEFFYINEIISFFNDTENFRVGGYDLYIDRTHGYYMCGNVKHTYSVLDLNEMKSPSAEEVKLLIKECRNGFDKFMEEVENNNI